MRPAQLSEAKLLAVDTCFGACSAAVFAGTQILASRRSDMARGHAEALAPMVEAVMQAAGLSFAELDRLAVTTGPGSFTGQRVGLAFMRGLRLALKKPLIGITSLAAMAEQARHETGCATAAAVHDAKRDEVYVEIPGHMAAPQILTCAEAAVLFAGFPGIALAGSAAPYFAKQDVIVTAITAPDALWVGRLAATAEDVGTPRPLYLRAPDAKLPGARKA
jgi:tRNA threonylcarbamoyladenosine biosynthesis protein TsaB